MTKEEQTDQVKCELYALTEQFVKKYVWRYYKQFQGDIQDLVSEYYCSFLTPKSREKGKEESLLDKFNPEITTLPYLVKISVQRKLIDSSRHDCRHSLRLDNYIDDFGDCITQAFQLTTEQDKEVGVDNRTFSIQEAQSIKLRFEKMAEASKKVFYEKLSEIRNVLAPAYRDLFSYVVSGYEEDQKREEEKASTVITLSVKGYGECAVQQVTDKTACVFIEPLHRVVNFNRFTGYVRGSEFQGLELEEESVDWMADNVVKWHSGKSRQEFEM